VPISSEQQFAFADFSRPTLTKHHLIQALVCSDHQKQHFSMDPTNDVHLESAYNQPRESPEAKGAGRADTNGESKTQESAFKGLGWLDRLLALWILLAMVVGILLGNFVPSVGPALHKGELVGVSLPIGESSQVVATHTYRILILLDIAIGLLVMMYPILCKVQYETLHLVTQSREMWVQLGFSIVLNWLIAPFLMVHSP
jgi:ACR3 family arsenite transporter